MVSGILSSNSFPWPRLRVRCLRETRHHEIQQLYVGPVLLSGLPPKERLAQEKQTLEELVLKTCFYPPWKDLTLESYMVPDH